MLRRVRFFEHINIRIKNVIPFISLGGRQRMWMGRRRHLFFIPAVLFHRWHWNSQLAVFTFSYFFPSFWIGPTAISCRIICRQLPRTETHTDDGQLVDESNNPKCIFWWDESWRSVCYINWVCGTALSGEQLFALSQKVWIIHIYIFNLIIVNTYYSCDGWNEPT